MPVTVSDALFDATPYGRSRKAKTVAPPPSRPETVTVLGGTWIGVSRSTPGMAHYIVGPKRDKHGQVIAAAVSACGLSVVPHTYDPGEQRPGCGECAQRMKRG